MSLLRLSFRSLQTGLLLTRNYYSVHLLRCVTTRSDLPPTPGDSTSSARGVFERYNVQIASVPRYAEAHSSIISSRTKVNGVKIHFDRTGNGKKVLLLMPGVLGCVRTDFQLQIENLNKDFFTIIGWDPRGHGRSRPPDRDYPDKFLERDAIDAVKLLENIGVKKFSLLGWGDGGASAILAAARYPDRVQKLVVWGSSSTITSEEESFYGRFKDLDAWNKRLRSVFLQVYDDIYLRQRLTDWVDARKKHKANKGGDICSSELQHVRCPTLVIHGANDQLVPISQAQNLKDNIKNSKLEIISDGKHNVHQHNFRVFNSVVERFLVDVHE